VVLLVVAEEELAFYLNFFLFFPLKVLEEVLAMMEEVLLLLRAV
jgi:hypothetical protein